MSFRAVYHDFCVLLMVERIKKLITDLPTMENCRKNMQIKTLHIYDPSEEVKRVRKLMLLDGCRNDFYVDDVIVHLIKQGNELEECWVRTNKLENKLFTGTLLNEPNQDFRYHKGDEIQLLSNL